MIKAQQQQQPGQYAAQFGSHIRVQQWAFCWSSFGGCCLFYPDADKRANPGVYLVHHKQLLILERVNRWLPLLLVPLILEKRFNL